MFDAKKTPRDMSNVSNMILTNSKGKSRVNKMVSRSLDGNKKQIIWFLEPKDDKGVAFLKIEHENKDDEMRMWLPAFNKVRRISSKKKGDSFMGSDLSYEDLSNRDIDDHTYNRIDDEIIDYVSENKSVVMDESIKDTFVTSKINAAIDFDADNTIDILNRMGILGKTPLVGSFKDSIIERRLMVDYLDDEQNYTCSILK